MAFWRDVFRAATAKMSGEKFTDYAREEQERKRTQALGKQAINQRAVELKRLLAEKETEANLKVETARLQGNTNLPYVEITGGWLSGQEAVIRYNISGDRKRIDVFYGGKDWAFGEGHGHIVIRDNVVVTWLEPADENGIRNQLI